jgi:hypothetical protein
MWLAKKEKRNTKNPSICQGRSEAPAFLIDVVAKSGHSPV